MNEDGLIVFSWVLVATLLGVVIHGFLTRRADLFDTRTLLLLGAVNFVGLSAIALVYFQRPLADYRSEDYLLFAAGTVVFFASFLVTYSWWRLPRRLGGRVMLAWPPASNAALLLMIGACLSFQFLNLMATGVPVVGQVLFLMSLYAPIFASVLAICYWHQRKWNPVAIAIMLATIVAALVMSVAVGSGRRWILAVLLSAPVTLYWLNFRYRPRVQVLVIAGVAMVCVGLLINGWSKVRHTYRNNEKKDIVTTVETLAEGLVNVFNTSTISQVVGYDTANVSLLSIAYLREKRYEVSPFHSVIFVAVNPVPRAWWPDKPKAFGYLLPREIYRVQGSSATWGAGIVGHGFHEGGLLMLVFYGVLAGAASVFFDSLLRNQPNNPYLIAWLVSVSGQVLGWTRGDIGTFTLQMIAATLFTALVVLLGKLMMGSGLRYHTEDVRNAAEYYMRHYRSAALGAKPSKPS